MFSCFPEHPPRSNLHRSNPPIKREFEIITKTRNLLLLKYKNICYKKIHPYKRHPKKFNFKSLFFHNKCKSKPHFRPFHFSTTVHPTKKRNSRNSFSHFSRRILSRLKKEAGNIMVINWRRKRP